MFTIFLNFHLDIHLGTSQCSPGLFSMFTIFTWTLRLQPLPRLPLRSHLLLSIDWLLGWLLVWSVEILSCSILIRVCFFCLFFVCLFVSWLWPISRKRFAVRQPGSFLVAFNTWRKCLSKWECREQSRKWNGREGTLGSPFHSWSEFKLKEKKFLHFWPHQERPRDLWWQSWQ